MTDLEAPDRAEMAAPKAGKRERLVAAARQIFHEHGVETTTLADIAHAADVPPGNVYYYFKAKDDLVDAVVDSHAQDVRAMLHSLERHRTPKARLRALVHALTDQSDLAARSGCPLGSLCQELDKRHDGLDRSAVKLMQLQIDWAEQQFRLLGRRDARDLAVSMIATYQGISLLTNTFRDPELMVREGRRLERWIDSLA
ncbi:MAG TPA: TetR/AcrR family transcriptional regulator [Acidimicrobiales bacterium]|nr:TetR/AcrR family transcriptional regulator [Acidimicrobiales bacterium]